MMLKNKNRRLKIKFFIWGLSFCILVSIFSFYDTAASAPAESEPDQSVSSGSELISLDFKGADILEVFRLLSRKTGINIVTTKGVSGRINLFINNVTFEDILDIVLVTNDLAAEKQGNIIKVMTATEYQTEYGKKYSDRRQVATLKLTYAKPKDISSALTQIQSDIGKVVVDEATGTLILIDIPEKLTLMQKMVEKLDQPAVTKIFELNYAKAEDIQNKLSNILTSTAQTVQIDKRTNKIMVTDLANRMEEISKLIKEFDAPTRQVLVETDIWQLSLTDTFKRGVDWEKIARGIDDFDFKGSFPLSLSAPYQKISIGTVSRDDYTATFELLSTYGKTDILSRPRVAIMDGEEAKILIGSKEAYITTTLSQAESSTTTSESVDYIDVGVQLSVVPTINKDGFVTMKLKPSVSSVRETLTTSQGTRVPIVETSEVETTVKIKDGNTIFIAGLIKETKAESTSGIPILSRIPIIKWLFSTYSRGPSSGTAKTELIICITPHIITGEAPVYTVPGGSILGDFKQSKKE